MSSGSRDPARVEERAELEALREQAAQTRRDAASTLAVLADKVAARDPRRWASRAALSRVPRSRVTSSRAVLIGAPALLLVIAALVAYRRYRLASGKRPGQ